MGSHLEYLAAGSRLGSAHKRELSPGWEEPTKEMIQRAKARSEWRRLPPRIPKPEPAPKLEFHTEQVDD